MAAFQPQLELAYRLGVPQVPAGQFMVTPLDSEVIIVGRAEPAAQAVIEGVQILAEVAPGPLTASPMTRQKSSRLLTWLPSTTYTVTGSG